MNMVHMNYRGISRPSQKQRRGSRSRMNLDNSGHKVAFTPDTCIPDEQLVDGYT